MINVLKMSSKWKSSYDSARKYNPEWEKKYVWCCKAPGNSDEAYCKLCKCTLNPKTSSQSDHEKTKKHLKHVPAPPPKQLNVTKIPRTPDSSKNSDVKQAEIQLAVSVVCHCSLRSIDHLGELLVRHGTGSTLGQIRLHRTKCACLITNVIAPSLKDQLIVDLKGKKYTLIIDESTDVSIHKHLCLLVRFFCEREHCIQTRFLELVPILDAKAENIFSIIEERIAAHGQVLINCIGLGVDGAATMVGKNNSVWTRIVAASPHCVLMKCICHSLALCIEHAAGKLPSNIGYILSEIPHWFCNSDLRRDNFKSIFDTINQATESEQSRAAPLPFQKLSTTRWLVRGKVMMNILSNWEELIVYFTAFENSKERADTRYKARLLKDMLMDKTNLLYFHFALPIVNEFERVNALFQHSKMDPSNLNNELVTHHQSLKFRLYSSDGSPKSLENVDFGVKFQYEVQLYLQSKQNSEAALHEIQTIKTRCRDMLMEALYQVSERLPPQGNVFKDLSKLTPSAVLNQACRSNFSDLPFPHLKEGSDIEEQYRKILHVDWSTEMFKGNIPQDAELFWAGVLKHDNFKGIARYALSCLTMPVSNATVERVFSLVTAIKTKPRNRMGIQMLDSILRIRSELLLNEKSNCCKDFEATSDMLTRFKSDIMYRPQISDESGSRSDSSTADVDVLDLCLL